MRGKTCLNCVYYVPSEGEERDRTSFDFCSKKEKCLPAAAFSFNDVCGVGTHSYFNTGAFCCLEEVANECEYYEEKLV